MKSSVPARLKVIQWLRPHPALLAAICLAVPVQSQAQLTLRWNLATANCDNGSVNCPVAPLLLDGDPGPAARSRSAPSTTERPTS